MYQSTSRNDDVDSDKRPEPRIFMHSDRAFTMQLTTLVTYEWRPVVTLIETDEKMSPSPVQALYAKLHILLLCMCDNMRFTQSGMYIISTTVETVLRIYGQALRRNISPGRVFHDILHASKSAIHRNVNSVLSRKWLMDVRTSMAQRGNDYNALPEDVLDHSSHDATDENRYDAAAKNGDAAAKNGDAAAKNGDAAAKNGDAAAKNGDAAAKNGNAAAKNGNAAAKNGDAAAKNGDAAVKNGNAAAKNGDAAAKNGAAAAKNGGRILWNNSGNDTDRSGPNVRNDDYSRATVDDGTIE